MSDLFAFLEADQTKWKELEPDTLVRYTGSMLKSRGLWFVKEQVDDDMWALSHPSLKGVTIIADRCSIEVVGGGHGQSDGDC